MSTSEEWEDITASKKVSLSSPWRGSAASSWGCRGVWRMHGWSGSVLSVGRVELALDTQESSACTLADRLERACGILAVAWMELLHKRNNKIALWCSDNSRGVCRFWQFFNTNVVVASFTSFFLSVFRQETTQQG